MEMMERYAKNLEQMVELRTKELKEERRRADELLKRMIPQYNGRDDLPNWQQSAVQYATRTQNFWDRFCPKL